MSESKEYMTLPDENGTIHISEEVIAAIAVDAVREIEGVSGIMTSLNTTVTNLVSNKKNARKGIKGVRVKIENNALTLDVYLSVCYGYPIPDVAEKAQKAVTSAVTAMTGCTVEAVNIHVGGIALS